MIASVQAGADQLLQAGMRLVPLRRSCRHNLVESVQLSHLSLRATGAFLYYKLRERLAWPAIVLTVPSTPAFFEPVQACFNCWTS